MEHGGASGSRPREVVEAVVHACDGVCGPFINIVPVITKAKDRNWTGIVLYHKMRQDAHKPNTVSDQPHTGEETTARRGKKKEAPCFNIARGVRIPTLRHPVDGIHCRALIYDVRVVSSTREGGQSMTPPSHVSTGSWALRNAAASHPYKPPAVGGPPCRLRTHR